MNPTIRVDSAVTTRISVFTVDPDVQPKLLALLWESIDPIVSKLPGWISSSYLTSKDRTQILVYSQWRSEKDQQAAGQDPQLKHYLQQVAAMGKLAAFTCDVSYSNHA